MQPLAKLQIEASDGVHVPWVVATSTWTPMAWSTPGGTTSTWLDALATAGAAYPPNHTASALDRLVPYTSMVPVGEFTVPPVQGP